MMKVQVADSWKTQLRRRFECNLQSMATPSLLPSSPRNWLLPLPHWWSWWLCWKRNLLHCICRLPQCHPPVEIWSWFQTQVHQVLIHHLVQSTSPGSDSSSTCWHRCWQPPWPWRGGSSGSGSPPNSSFSLLTINTAGEKAALSWPDLVWEVAGRMQSHPKSWIPHLSGEAAALTVGCPLQPEEGLAGILSHLPGKQPSVWKTGHHLQENNNTVLLLLLIFIDRMIYGLQHN